MYLYLYLRLFAKFLNFFEKNNKFYWYLHNLMKNSIANTLDFC